MKEVERLFSIRSGDFKTKIEKLTWTLYYITDLWKTF